MHVYIIQSVSVLLRMLGTVLYAFLRFRMHSLNQIVAGQCPRTGAFGRVPVMLYYQFRILNNCSLSFKIYTMCYCVL